MIQRRCDPPFSSDFYEHNRPYVLANLQRALADDETRFMFFRYQSTATDAAIIKRTRIDAVRLYDLSRGLAAPTPEEAAKCAPIFQCEPSDLLG